LVPVIATLKGLGLRKNRQHWGLRLSHSICKA
jgi:hypothetical protein